jgi:uncharacterized membrane protein
LTRPGAADRDLRRPALLGAIAVSTSYFALVTWLCSIEHRCFLYGFDLAWYGNLLASGKDKWPLFSTLHRSWFGDHFEPIGALLVPLFRIFPTVWTLLLLQNLVFASVPLLCFLLAAELFGDDRRALLAALLSVANPALWYINLNNFHWTVVTIPLTIAYFLALERRRSGWAWIALGTMLLCKEDAALLVVPLCLAHYVTFRDRRSALLAAGAATVVFLILNLALMPAIGSPAPVRGWGYLGHSVGGIVATVLGRPGVLATHLFTATNAEYLVELLLPFCFASLLDWRLWLAAPVATTFALSNEWPRHTIASQSAAMVVACVIVSGLYGLRRLLGWLPRAPRGQQLRTAALAAVLAVAIMCFARPMPPIVASRPYVALLRGGPATWMDAGLCPERAQLEAILAYVPADPDVAVVAEGRLATRLVDHARLQIYNWRGQPASDYREFDVVLGSDGVLTDGPHRRRKPKVVTRNRRWTMLMNDPSWEHVYGDAGGYFVLRNRQGAVGMDATVPAPRSESQPAARSR